MLRGLLSIVATRGIHSCRGIHTRDHRTRMVSISKPALAVCLLLALFSTFCVSSVEAKLKLKNSSSKQFVHNSSGLKGNAKKEATKNVEEVSARNTDKIGGKKLTASESTLPSKKNRSKVSDADNPSAGSLKPQTKPAKAVIREKLAKVKKQLQQKPQTEKSTMPVLLSDKKGKQGKGKFAHRHEHTSTEKRADRRKQIRLLLTGNQ